ATHLHGRHFALCVAARLRVQQAIREGALMRRALPLALLVAALAALPSATACSRSAPATDDPSRPRVALLLSTLQEERYQKDRDYFLNKARALGVAPFTLAADNDNAKQLSQVEDALARGAKVLVVQPTDSVAAAAYVSKAHERGAKIVAYDRSISGSPDF